MDLKTWVIIRGLSQNTTEDALLNYFENTRRSGGGPVEEVNMKGDWARIKFESAEGTVYAILACETYVFPFFSCGEIEQAREQTGALGVSKIWGEVEGD